MCENNGLFIRHCSWKDSGFQTQAIAAISYNMMGVNVMYKVDFIFLLVFTKETI